MLRALAGGRARDSRRERPRIWQKPQATALRKGALQTRRASPAQQLAAPGGERSCARCRPGRRRNAIAGLHRPPCASMMPEASRLAGDVWVRLLDAARADAQPEVVWADARAVRRGRLNFLRSHASAGERIVAKSWRWQDGPPPEFSKLAVRSNCIDDADGSHRSRAAAASIVRVRARASAVNGLRPGARMHAPHARSRCCRTRRLPCRGARANCRCCSRR